MARLKHGNALMVFNSAAAMLGFAVATVWPGLDIEARRVAIGGCLFHFVAMWFAIILVGRTSERAPMPAGERAA